MDGTTWVVVVSTAITGALGVLTLYINRKFDKKLTEQEVKSAACEEGHAKTAAELGKCKEKHELNDTVNAKHAAQIAAHATQIAVLEQAVNDKPTKG